MHEGGRDTVLQEDFPPIIFSPRGKISIFSDGLIFFYPWLKRRWCFCFQHPLLSWVFCPLLRLSNCVSAQDFCVPLLSTGLRIWLPVGQVSVCPTRTLQITCPRAESVPSPVESVNLLYSCLCGGCCGPPSCPGHPGQQPDADRNWSWELLFQDNCCSVLSNMCFVSSLIKMECLYWLIAWISDWDLNGSKSWPHFSLVLWP